MQKDSIHLTNPEAALTLRSSAILQYFFLEPISPSDVAKKANLAANLVHHHAKKALELGLLEEVKRENGKVFFQLSAKQFTYHKNLLPFEQKELEDLRLISTAFLDAYQRSDALFNQENSYVLTHGFVTEESSELPRKSKHTISLEKHPAHLLARTFYLGQSRYRKLMNDISDLITEAKSETTREASACSFVLMGFDGQWNENQKGTDTITVNGFVPSRE